MSTGNLTSAAPVHVDPEVLRDLAGAFQHALYRHEQALSHPGGSLDATQTRIAMYAAMEAFYRLAKVLTRPGFAAPAPSGGNQHRRRGARR